MRAQFVNENEEQTIDLLTWLKNFKSGKYDAPDLRTQIDAGWYDWFCGDRSLAAKTKILGRKLAQIVNSPKINPVTSYVFFKNNCPMVGNLYDDFRICDIKTGNVIYTIVPRSGFKKDAGAGQVWGRENEFKEPLVTGSWADIVKWFYS